MYVYKNVERREEKNKEKEEITKSENKEQKGITFLARFSVLTVWSLAPWATLNSVDGRFLSFLFNGNVPDRSTFTIVDH